MSSESATTLREIEPGVWRISDTCNVYVIVRQENGSELTGIAVDFGSGLVLDLLDEIGITRLTDVVMTHHHRDQSQGLPLAAAAGIRIHVPPVERHLFDRVEDFWLSRRVENDYDLRQDRFSLLASVPVASSVPEYREEDYGGVALRVLPTPGHTVGSVSYLLSRDSRTIAFTGDLIFSAGKVWSMAATQWTYNNAEGQAMTALSAYILQDEAPDLLLPSHGEPIANPHAALDLLAENMQEFFDARIATSVNIKDRLRNPFVNLSKHLLLNRSSNARTFVLLSDTGNAMYIDSGYDMVYDMMPGLLGGRPRESCRPNLTTLKTLKTQFGVKKVEVGLPTHYHDDHVAGYNLLRDVEGTEIWIADNFVSVLENPKRYDLPCLWYEPIPADRVLPVGATFRWHEYEITVHNQPGHTFFAVAFEVEVDGVRMLFTGDQQSNLGSPTGRGEILNFQYRNRFQVNDYRDSAALYKRVMPGLMLGAHWDARAVDQRFLDYLEDEGDKLIERHERLLPLDQLGLGADSILARLLPYQAEVQPNQPITYTASVKNPFDKVVTTSLFLTVPPGWSSPEPREIELAPNAEIEVEVGDVVVGSELTRRARIALDVTIGELRLGQHAEALVDIR